MSHKCIIIDDEPPAIALIRNHVSLLDDIEVVGECLSAVKAFELLKKTEVDLIFLDIQMPVLTGLDFLKSLKNPPKVILTTAYREYAIEGYDLDIVDYLLNPISFQRFLKAIERFLGQMESKPVSAVSTEIARLADHFFVNINKKSHKIVFSDVLYIESLKDYVRIHTTGKPLVVKSNIGAICKQLPSTLFVRVHRSFVVSIEKISAFTAQDIEIGKIEIPIGASYKDLVMSRIK